MKVPIQYQIHGEGSNEIAASIERAIREGRLPPGARLPTVRALAKDLHRSLGTVAAAYRTLQSRGVILSSGRRGTIVRSAPPVWRSIATNELPAGIANLSDGNPDPALLPKLGPAFKKLPQEPALYGAAAQDEALLEMAARSFKADGVPWSAVAVVGGALDGIERALAANLRAGDRIAVEDPIYPAHLDLLSALGLVPEPVAIDDRGLIPERLERSLRRGARAILLTPRAQNPTGAAHDHKRQHELRAVIAASPEVFVVEDDHAWLVAGVPYRTLSEGREQWFVVRSFSKPFGPDLRIAIAAGDPMTISRVRGRQQLGAGWVSHLLQSLAVTLWSDPHVLRTISKASRTYAARRDAFIAALAHEGIAARTPSGLNCWIPVHDEAAVLAALRTAGFAAAPGARFRIESPPAVRVSISRLLPRESAPVARAVAATRRIGTATRTT